MFFLIIFLLLLPTATPAKSTTTFSQSIQLHEGWNLVSLNVMPGGRDRYRMLVMADVLDPAHPWFTTSKCRIFSQYDRESFYPNTYLRTEEWHTEWAYYFYSSDERTWHIEGIDKVYLRNFEIRPGTTWDANRRIPVRPIHAWFFLGYPLRKPIPVASIPKLPGIRTGHPADYAYCSPLHDLIWERTDDGGYTYSNLRIVKDDEGRVYIPSAHDPGKAIDQIGVLKPGEGYLLGFYCEPGAEYLFDAWRKVDEQAFDQPLDTEPDIEKTVHFRFNRRTNWSYPVVIDTLDLALCHLEDGDEIAVFCGDLCVGAAVYRERFPLVIAAWQKDQATSFMVTDGYIPGYPMTFVCYDRSENREVALIAYMANEPQQDNPIAPRYGVFGQGFYARRSFLDGILWVRPLPETLRVSQNYPNPFNASTVFPLELPQRSRVRIDVFDISGRKVWTVSAGVQNAGWPKVHYNASRLSSGVYFYRVTAEGLERGGTYQDVGKMLLLK
jgi:hypothetical protein